jgi:hypothetical protein
MVDEVKGKRPGTTAEALRQLADDHSLSYFFGGLMVACLDSPEGRTVLACGRAEVQALCHDIPWTERRSVCIYSPLPWGCAGYL